MKKLRSVTVFVPKMFCEARPNDGKLQYQHRLGAGVPDICVMNDELTTWLDNCGVDYKVDTYWHDGVSVCLPDDRNLVTLKLTWPQIILL